MDWEKSLPTIITGLVSFVSGFGLAITKGLSKIIEDIWTDHRNEKKRITQRKRQIVSQLLFDIPRGKSRNFQATIKKSDGEQTISQIAAYDKNMSKKVGSYLDLWRQFASLNIQFERTHEVLVMAEDGQPEDKGLEYLESLLSKLYTEYDEIIDLLNEWQR